MILFSVLHCVVFAASEDLKESIVPEEELPDISSEVSTVQKQVLSMFMQPDSR